MKHKKFVGTAFLICLCLALGAGINQYVFLNTAQIVSSGPTDPLEAWSEFDYLVWQRNTTHYAMRNMSTLFVEFSNTNLTHVETLCVNNLTAAGGTVFLKGVAWNTSITLPSNVQIHSTYQGYYYVWGDNGFWIRGVNKTETLDNLDCPVATSGTFTMPNVPVYEQIIFEVHVTPANITVVNQLYVDLYDLTKNCTIKIYFKVDGASYRECTAMRLTNLGYADQKALVLHDLTLACDMKITIMSLESEGATRYIPYLYIWTVW